MRYVLNKRSGVLHRLPASESCNTDDIRDEYRFDIHASEELVTLAHDRPWRYCVRCFPVTVS